MRTSAINSLSALKSKLNFFYILAFAPLVLIGYYKYVTGRSILGVLIPLYGFLLLFFKRDALSQFPDAGRKQGFVGIATALISFFVYYELIRFGSFAFYGAAAAFYAIYVIGLFLIFFGTSALKESFSAFFLLVAGGSSFYVCEWLEYFMQPLVPYFVQVMWFVLILLGIPAAIHNPTVIVLNAPRGSVPVAFEAGCMGIWSFFIFSVIIVVTMMEETGSVRTRLLWSLGGILGTFVMNLVRVSLISVVIYYFGYARWGEIHSRIGYALFLLWLAFFFVAFSKREAIRNKIRAFRHKF